MFSVGGCCAAWALQCCKCWFECPAAIASTVMAILSGRQWADCVQGILFSASSSKPVVCAPLCPKWSPSTSWFPRMRLWSTTGTPSVQNLKMEIPLDSICGHWLLLDRIIEGMQLKKTDWKLLDIFSINKIPRVWELSKEFRDRKMVSIIYDCVLLALLCVGILLLANVV